MLHIIDIPTSSIDSHQIGYEYLLGARWHSVEYLQVGESLLGLEHQLPYYVSRISAAEDTLGQIDIEGKCTHITDTQQREYVGDF